MAIMDTVADFFFCDGYRWTTVWEYIEEHIWNLEGKIFMCDLSKLTETARNKVLDVVEEYWQKNPEKEGAE